MITYCAIVAASNLDSPEGLGCLQALLKTSQEFMVINVSGDLGIPLRGEVAAGSRMDIERDSFIPERLFDLAQRRVGSD
jgi:hypothetical protein